ncbi:MAG: MerR family transcriptional regulator [Coriobacteriia bacterium]|nr:MerR family transcriptional regulator [Coriobacteriia bacterium]
MERQEQEAQELMSVGDLASRVGVTVRTVQYYDQKGLLHPSQTGPGNQRRYSAEDEAELHHILVLKYLGLSLSQIAERLDATRERAELAQVVAESHRKLDDELMGFFQRLSTLRELSAALEGAEQVDWRELKAVIDRGQADKDAFWGSLAAEDAGESAGLTRSAVLEWHGLMGQAIEAMQRGVQPDDPQARELGERFAALGGMDVAAAGLMRMGQDKGLDFYHMLQDRTLEFLQAAGGSDPQA